MASLRELRRRIKSVDGIRQITRAMEMVSATKLRRAQERIEQGRPYTDKMDDILSHLASAARAGSIQHPLMEPRETVEKILLVCVASDKGLCGSFNTNLIRRVEQDAKKAISDGLDLTLLPIGKKIHDYFRRRNWKLHPDSENYRSIDQSLPMSLLQAVTENCTNAFLNGDADRVDMIYMEFKSAIVHRVTQRQFLPIADLDTGSEDDAPSKGVSDYIFEPGPEELFGLLIPKYARVVIFRMLADSLASEHGGRMNAMHNATDNAQDMISTLTLHRNKARQASITKELSEIVSGAEALVG